MRAVAIGIVGAVLAGAAVACSFPSVEDNCRIVCGSNNFCPEHMTCGDNFYCYAGDVDPMCPGPADAGVADARVTIDATPPADADPDEADLRPDPTWWDFQPILVGGQTSAVDFEITNFGLHTSGVMTATIATGDWHEFTIVTDDCSGTVLAGTATCTISAAFAPQGAGALASALQVSASPGGVASVAISGTAGALGLSPAAQDFGTIETGSSSSGITFTVTTPAYGSTGELTVSIVGTDASDFGLENDHCTGTTLASGSNCEVTVFFAPGTTGDKSASLTAAGNPGGSASSTLTGTAFTAAR